MVRLVSSRSMFVFQDNIDSALRKKSASACAAFLLNCCYTNEELTGKNRSDTEAGINKEIREAIVGEYTIK